jgi:hypothetical protein
MNVAVGGSRQEKLAAAHHGFTIQYRSVTRAPRSSTPMSYRARFAVRLMTAPAASIELASRGSRTRAPIIE